MSPSNAPLLPIQISPNKRYFVDQKGQPVFWLGTTQWELFRRFTPEEAAVILKRSAANGFNFAQVMLMGVGEGTGASVQGHGPWIHDDPLRPHEPYFANVDVAVREAAKHGLTISMTIYHQRYRQRITLQKARAWGKWVGARYKDAPNIVWSMTPEATPEFAAIVRELAAGLREADGGRHLITFKPDPSPYTSSFIHAEGWLDFNSMQTWKWPNLLYPMVTADYNQQPTKPVLMAEGAYEAGTEYGFPVTPLWVRRQAYYSYLAGASHTYGHNDSWRALPTWRAALDAPGAVQMGVLRKIFEAIPEWWRLVPDQSILTEGGVTGGDWLNLSARHEEGRWIMVYLAGAAKFTVDLTKLAAKGKATWIDPRAGDSRAAGAVQAGKTQTFTTPKGWEDALLLLETTTR